MTAKLAIGATIILAVAVPVWSFLQAADPVRPQATQGTVVLSETSIWQIDCREGGVRKDDLADPDPVPSPLPASPAGWQGSDFDDLQWLRARGPLFRGIGGGTYSSGLAGSNCRLVLARSRFLVAAPAQATAITLEVDFRGGLVVYLNGTEIGRSGLPAGDLKPETLALSYPIEAFALADGVTSVKDRNIAEHPEVIAARTRHLSLRPAPGTLHPGINVLALELHAAVNSIGKNHGKRLSDSNSTYWSGAGLDMLKLAISGGGPESNIEAPPRFAVWNANTLQALSPGKSPAGQVPGVDADGLLPLGPMRILAPRGGFGFGMVGTSDARGVRGLVATLAGPLLREGGGSIPAERCAISYGLKRPDRDLADLSQFDKSMPDYLSDLAAQAPEGPLVPIVLAIEVPAEAAAGIYTGTMVVKATGVATPVSVPVRLQVAPWMAPKPSEQTVRFDMFQSPDSTAQHYKVPLYSPEHFRIMEKSFRLMGQLGNRTVWIPLVAQACDGQTQSMVRYEKTAAGWDFDFSTMDAYLDLQQKYCGSPDMVMFQVRRSGYGEPNGKDFDITVPTTSNPMSLTGKDGKTEIKIDNYSPEGEVFWKSLFSAIHERILKRGWKEDVIFLGMVNEPGLRPRMGALFQRVAPYARWMCLEHDTNFTVGGSYPAGYWAVARPSGDGQFGWTNPRMVVDHKYYKTVQAPMAILRTYPERALNNGMRGIGKIGADFWMMDDAKGNPLRPEVWVAGQPAMAFSNYYPALFSPGPDGSRATLHSLHVREALGVAEARIAVEKFLVRAWRKAHPGIDQFPRGLWGNNLGQTITKECGLAPDLAMHIHDVYWNHRRHISNNYAEDGIQYSYRPAEAQMRDLALFKLATELASQP